MRKKDSSGSTDITVYQPASLLFEHPHTPPTLVGHKKPDPRAPHRTIMARRGRTIKLKDFALMNLGYTGEDMIREAIARFCDPRSYREGTDTLEAYDSMYGPFLQLVQWNDGHTFRDVFKWLEDPEDLVSLSMVCRIA